MVKLEKFTGNKTYMFPNGTVATPDRIINNFPAVQHFTHVIEVNGNVCQAVMELAALRQMHNIDDSLTEEEAIQAIQDILNAPLPEPELTPEERIAAAMEFQNMMLL
jgi:hypothetical protein